MKLNKTRCWSSFLLQSLVQLNSSNREVQQVCCKKTFVVLTCNVKEDDDDDNDSDSDNNSNDDDDDDDNNDDGKDDDYDDDDDIDENSNVNNNNSKDNDDSSDNENNHDYNGNEGKGKDEKHNFLEKQFSKIKDDLIFKQSVEYNSDPIKFSAK